MKLHIENLLQCVFVPADVLAGFRAIWSVPILALKESVQYIQKGHATLVTQVELMLQDWWEFKVLVAIGLNLAAHMFYDHILYIALFTLSYFF